MRHILALTLLLTVSQSIAQSINWTHGKIMLNDGTEAEGKLAYNELTGIVSFESEKNSGSYNARTIIGFEYLNKHFYSIPYAASTGLVKQFFEVVREYKDFVVISKTNALTASSTSEITTLYFMHAADLTVKPFLEVLDREVKWKIFDANKTQVRVLDSTLPKKIMGDNFEKVKAFARERKLVWHVKDSLISILDYYDSLVN
ncbi:MAG: hypothetical protein WDO14_09460 [Bacteroidota bacterium]